MSETDAAIWDELVSIIPNGVLGNTDRIALEHLARLVAESRGDRSKWTSAREKDLLSYLSRFGMTPSDRSRVQVPRAPSGNPFEQFL